MKMISFAFSKLNKIKLLIENLEKILGMSGLLKSMACSLSYGPV